MEVLSHPIRLPGRHDQTVCLVVVALGGLAEVGDGDQSLGLGGIPASMITALACW